MRQNALIMFDNILNIYKIAAKQFNNKPDTHPITDNLKPICQSSFIDCRDTTTPTTIRSANVVLIITTLSLVHKRTNRIFTALKIMQPFHEGEGSFSSFNYVTPCFENLPAHIISAIIFLLSF